MYVNGAIATHSSRALAMLGGLVLWLAAMFVVANVLEECDPGHPVLTWAP